MTTSTQTKTPSDATPELNATIELPDASAPAATARTRAGISWHCQESGRGATAISAYVRSAIPMSSWTPTSA